MARLCKCYGCENKFSKEELEPISAKNYCSKCASVIKQNKIDRAELIETIKTLYKIDYPTGLMLKQIKDFETERGYKLKGIVITLLYCKEQLDVTFHQKYGLGIVPMHYENAKKYWIDKQRRIKNHVNVELKTRKVIVREAKEINNYKKSLLIDLGDIL